MTDKDMAVPEVEVARYAAPQVSAVPVTDVITGKPLGDRRPGHCQTVLLDARSGELHFHENPHSWEPWLPLEFDQ